MPSKPINPNPTPCPRCGANMGPHCQRTIPKHGGQKARACGWAVCPKSECQTVIRIRDHRILPTLTGPAKWNP